MIEYTKEEVEDLKDYLTKNLLPEAGEYLNSYISFKPGDVIDAIFDFCDSEYDIEPYKGKKKKSSYIEITLFSDLKDIPLRINTSSPTERLIIKWRMFRGK